MPEASTALPQQSQTEMPSTSKSPSPLKTTYLVLYNFVSVVLWLTVLGRVVSISSLMGSTEMVFKTASEFTKWTQTLSILEIVHSALGESNQTSLISRHWPSQNSILCHVIFIGHATSVEKRPSLQRKVSSALVLYEVKLTSRRLQVSSALLS